LPARNTLVQLLAFYTDPESRNAHLQTGRRTERRTDGRHNVYIAVRPANKLEKNKL